MAHRTADGKRSFTNASMARQYDKRNTLRRPGDEDVHDPEGEPSTRESYGKGTPGATTQRSRGASESPEEPEGMDDADGAPELLENNLEDPSGAEMHDKHGPAHKIVIQHDESSGMHTVQTDHPDSHSMITMHGSAEEAHKYAKDCAGCGE